MRIQSVIDNIMRIITTIESIVDTLSNGYTKEIEIIPDVSSSASFLVFLLKT
jgi:diacylglycerol kinase